MQFGINYSAPTRAPRSLRVFSVNETSVTISWEPLECLHHNGRITNYQVSYYYSEDTTETVETVTTGLNMMYTVVGLLPSINYTFAVKALNNDLSLTGPSASITITTLIPQGIC